MHDSLNGVVWTEKLHGNFAALWAISRIDSYGDGFAMCLSVQIASAAHGVFVGRYNSN
jgi:hypothetical protein